LNILILEDYSGLGRLLKDSLEQVGCKVTLIASHSTIGLGKEPDFVLTKRQPGFLSKCEIRFKLLSHLLRLRKFSVALILNQSIIFSGISTLVLWILKFKSQRRFLLSCGLDSVLLQNQIFDKLPGSFDINLIDANFVKRHQSKGKYKLLGKIVRNCDGVIPISHSFFVGWKLSEFKEKVRQPIAIPFPNIYSNSLLHNKTEECDTVRAVHFSSRREKGSHLIRSAFDRVNVSNNKSFRAHLKDRLPVDEFLSELARADIFVDRCTGSTYATINGLIALSMGKILVTKCIPEELQSFQIEECPVVCVDESSESVFVGLQKAYSLIIEDPELHRERCAEFLEVYHHPQKIGSEYVATFLNH